MLQQNMNTMLQQNMNTSQDYDRLGKYIILGQLSQGSTSIILKIKQNQRQSTQDQIQTEQCSPLIQINFDQKTINGNQTKQTSKEWNDFWILKQFISDKLISKEGQIISQVKFDRLIQILLLASLHHQGIVQGKSLVFQYKQQQQKQQQKKQKYLKKLGIIMEICQKGNFSSLLSYIDRTKVLKQNKNIILKFYLSQLAHTLSYLNQNGILHRDIKIENIIINKQLDIKIIDFGLSSIKKTKFQKLFKQKKQLIHQLFQIFNIDSQIECQNLYYQIMKSQQSRTNLIGSKHYISPELIQKYKNQMKMIDQAFDKTDIWSFGVFAYRIFTDKFPFQAARPKNILKLIQNDQFQCHFDQSMDQEVKQLIKLCLVKDYTQRISWPQLKKLKVFQLFPIDKSYEEQSPIKSILASHKQITKNRFQRIQEIIFSQKFMILQQNKTFKKRKVQLVKQKSFYSLLILKETEIIESQMKIVNSKDLKLTLNHNNINIQNQRQAIQIHGNKQRIQILFNSLTQTLFNSLTQTLDQNLD